MKHAFTDHIKQKQLAGLVPVIPDIKCRSPKEGDLLNGRDPVQIARTFAAAGAPVLSVVTEAEHFGGSLGLLSDIVQTTGLPVLRKDFIQTEQAIIETAQAGAAAVLLISSMLDRLTLEQMYHKALELGLEPLVEAHSKEELAFAASLGVRLTGLNNRDILQLERDTGTVQTTALLGRYKVPGSLLVSESAIGTSDDVRKALTAGADAVLVGTALLQSPDPVRLFRHFSNARPVLKICGLKKAEEVRLCLDLGVDILGFVTDYPVPVPWNLNRQDAAKLVNQVRSNSSSAKTCLVTGGQPDTIVDLAGEVRPDLIQLHYHETFPEIEQIVSSLKKINVGVIQRIPSDASARQRQFGTSELASVMQLLNQIDVAVLLADIRSPDNAAQTGLTFDSSFCRDVVTLSRKPVMIAGGITPDQISEAVQATGSAFVDIMTGVEEAPGIKDPVLLRQSVQAMHDKI